MRKLKFLVGTCRVREVSLYELGETEPSQAELESGHQRKTFREELLSRHELFLSALFALLYIRHIVYAGSHFAFIIHLKILSSLTQSVIQDSTGTKSKKDLAIGASSWLMSQLLFFNGI